MKSRTEQLWSRLFWLMLVTGLGGEMQGASLATLTGSFTDVPRGSIVNLTSEGPIDWVHWGLYSDSSVNHKAGVPQLIGDFSVIGNSNAFLAAYQFSDNYNGYSWNDGTPTAGVTNTTTGVWAYGFPNLGSGFEFVVPAEMSSRTLKVYVGAFDAQGVFEASLSNSSLRYTDSSLMNVGNGPGGVYAINFAGSSPGQVLTVKWKLLRPIGQTPNVTLQAAALTATNANNPPIIAITNPIYNATFGAPANITIKTAVTDIDPNGSVDLVEFYDEGSKLGESSSSPFTFVWNGASPGYHVLTARASDGSGASRLSAPVDIFVNGSGGTLLASSAQPPLTVNLTTEGTVDWSHWGLISSESFDQKQGVTQLIGDLARIGPNTVQQYSNNYTRYSWSDGTPTASASSTPTGVYMTGYTNGFQVRVWADTTLRRLKLYAGLFGARGNFQAFLSDGSAKAFTDTSLENVFGDSYVVYTLDYAAASADQHLIINYRTLEVFDTDFGNVTLQAATLSGGNIPPTVRITSPTNGATFAAEADVTINAEASDSDGTVSKVEFFNGTTKLGEDSSSTYSFLWTKVAAGAYTLTAKATDSNNSVFISRPVNIVVGGTPPSPVTILNPLVTGTELSFSFSTQSNHTYIVQYADSLLSSNWQTLRTISGDGSTVQVSDVTANASRRFYRVAAN